MKRFLPAQRLMCLAAMVGAHAAVSAAPAAELAVESFKFLETKELMLTAAVRNADRGDYMRFIWTPTLQQFQKWPREEAASGDYRDCYQALTAFQTYSDDQFKSGGKLAKSAPSAKPYFEHRAACARRLKGKV